MARWVNGDTAEPHRSLTTRFKFLKGEKVVSLALAGISEGLAKLGESIFTFQKGVNEMKAQVFSKRIYNRILSTLALVALLATMMVVPAEAVYVGVTERVSVSSEGVEGDDYSSWPSISADGRFVAFHSSATNLGISDSGNDSDIFIHDRLTGQLLHVTPDSNPIVNGGGSPSISADGQVVAFHRGVSGYDYSVFAYNRQTGETIVVCEFQGSRICSDPSISANGRYVAFESLRNNLVPGDTNGERDIFVFDLATYQTVRVSVSSDGTQADSYSSDPSISGDGRYVAFGSEATNLVSDDANGNVDVFVHDIQSGNTVCVSTNLAGVPGVAWRPTLSTDGRFVVFSSGSDDLVENDFNGYSDVFVHDRDLDQDGIFDEPGEVKTVLVSLAYDGRLGNSNTGTSADFQAISDNGRFVVFDSTATNLVPIDTNNSKDIFIHDRDLDEDGIFDEVGQMTTFRISVTSDGSQSDGVSTLPSVTSDGSLVAFASGAKNLVEGDTNNEYDVFIYQTLGVAFRVTGQVRSQNGSPLSDVAIIAGRKGRTTTEADGTYSLILPYGEYTLKAEKAGYNFSPETRTIALVQDISAADFVGLAVGDPPIPFLDLPFNYGGDMTVFEQAMRNHNNGDGWVQSWFDHKWPNYSEDNDTGLWLYQGVYDRNPQWKDGILGFDDYWYDGHDALDFAGGPFEVRSAAAGSVAEVCHGSCWRGASYGNYVVVDHGNGYATMYAHLASIQPGISVGASVSQGQQIGIMGGTGDWKVHLHFAVLFDKNDDGQWTANEVVDPFGWRQPGVDPWVSAGGPVSHRLWQHWTEDEATFIGDEPVLLQNTPGTIRSLIGTNTWLGQVTLELEPGPVAVPSAQLRSIGRSFWETLLEFFGFDGGGGASGQGVSAMDADPFAPQQAITQTVQYTDAEVKHINESQLKMYWWDETAGEWQQLPSTVDVGSNTVVATTMALGQFDVQGPLLCPSDSTEIDDSYYAASEMAVGMPETRWFDIPDDEDWLRVELSGGQTYEITTFDLAPGVSTNVEIYDLGGTQVIVSDLNGGEASIEWTALVTGTHFLRVSPASGSSTGCSASYAVSVTETTSPGPQRLYLPIILK